MSFLSWIAGSGVRKRENKLARARARAAEAQARRAKEQYEEESAGQEQQLESSLASRGLGKSSISSTNRALFQAARRRALDTLGENISIANKERRLVKAQRRMSNIMEPLNWLDEALGAGLGAAMGGGGMGGKG